MPRIKLSYINAMLFALIVLLTLFYRAELSWAARVLPGYFGGETPPLVELELAVAGLSTLQDGGELQEARRLLERSLSIEPHSSARHTLGEIHLLAGEPQLALEAFAKYNRIDPAWLPAYLRLAETYELLGQPAEALKILRQGVAYFSEQAPRYIPQPDATVSESFNVKAAGLYNSYLESLSILQAQIAARSPADQQP